MDSGNVSQLVVPNTLPVEHRNRIEFPEREAEFLSLRLLNKRARVRLSPAGIDYERLPGRTSLLAIGNTKGCFAAAIRKEDKSNYILSSSLGDLWTAFESGQVDHEPFIPFKPNLPLLSVPGTPNIVKFALNDERLLVAFVEGPILVYNTNDLFARTSGAEPTPIHAFPGDASFIPRDILPNPGENPELVAIMRGVHGQGPGHHIDVVDVQQLKHIAGWRKGDDPNAAPVSISWSPKGKQIAIGLQSGDMLLYNPLSPGSLKSHLLKPPSTPPVASSLLAITWLSNSTFHTVFSSPEASSTLFDPSTSDPPRSTHFISTHDSKSRSAVDVELRDPCPPFGAKRPPGPLSLVLRNWSPTNFIIFCGDGPSADIGVIGTLPNSSEPSDDGWGNFDLEETSTPSLPLDEEMNDTALLGLEIDLTSSKPVRVSEQPDDGTPDMPPSPILYAYTSDGSLIAWYILNSNGIAYPGMVAASQPIAGQVAPSTTQAKESVQAFGMPSPRVSPSSPSAPSTSSNAFSLEPPPAPSTAPAPAPGFGAFNSGNPTSKFGSTGFGFGNSPATAAFGTVDPPQGGQAKPTPSPAFGTTGFGQTSAFGNLGFGSKSAAPAFGQSGFGTPSSVVAKSPSAFGSSSGGFASFANQGTSAFGAPLSPPSMTTSKPAPTSTFGQGPFAQASAFGASGQGQASSSSAFGAGGVGQASKASPGLFGQQQSTQPASAFATFGQQAMPPAFGKSGFGNVTTTPPSQSGSFGAFGTLGDALETKSSPAILDSPPGSPPSPDESPPGSPELRPSSQLTKPVSTYLKPAEGFASFVKPAEGFGTFGGAAKPSSFLKAAEGSSSQQKPVVSAFAQQNSAAPAFNSPSVGSSASSSTAPTFGSTSALGRKPLFGTSSFGSGPQQVTEPSKPITGGFGAYSSGGGGGFASFAKDGKPASFADILSSGEKDKPKSDAASFTLGGTTASRPLEVPAPEIPNKMASTALAGESADIWVSSPAKGEEPSISPLSPETTLRATTTVPFGAPPTEAGDVRGGPRGADQKQEGAEDADGAGSEPFSLTDEDESDSEGVSRSPTRSLSEDESGDAIYVPLPQTPQDKAPPSISMPMPLPMTSAKTPEVRVSSLLPESIPSTSVVNGKEQSTTPPGSPEKTPTNSYPSSATPVAPKPVLPTSTSTPFGLGIGRPSSRPIRSSPLASAPITSADTEDSARDIAPSQSDLINIQGKPTEANVPSAPVLATAPASSTDATSTAKPRRPKTPPLLNTSSSTPGVKPVLESPFTLGQSPVAHVPLKSPGHSAVVTSVSSVPNQQASEHEKELPTHPMQLEFLRAYQEMVKELVQLYKKAQEMAMIRPIISEPRGLDKLVLNNQDFVPGKYSLGDLQAFATMIGTLQKKVIPLLDQGNANKLLLRDLQHLALMSETKQEELARWVRAREDPEFAKTLKPRTLGPEHSENQIRLRKAVQITSDRIQQCEDQMEALKRRLDQHKSGKVGFRPPSLDTIDRTCRNIQLALEERTKLLDQLHDRIETLSPSASQQLHSSPSSFRPSIPSSASVTPPFASVAAAALNSERSSLRLKNALLSARREPLFTTKVIKAEPPKPTSRSSQLSPQTQRPEWKLPPVPPLGSPSSSPSSPSLRRTGRSEKRHGAVPLKTNAPGTNTKPVAFDWGPLPGTTPMRQLSGDVRSQRGKGTTSFAKQDVGDDSEWDQEAQEDYQPHR